MLLGTKPGLQMLFDKGTGHLKVLAVVDGWPGLSCLIMRLFHSEWKYGAYHITCSWNFVWSPQILLNMNQASESAKGLVDDE